MYGYGYRYSAKPSVFAFNPLTDIAGLSLYLNKNTNVNTKIAADFVSANSEYLSSASTDFQPTDSDFSFTTWVNFDSLTGSFMGIGGASGELCYILYSNATAIESRISINGTAWVVAQDTSTTIAINTWYLAAFVYDSVNDLVKVSVNGNNFNVAAASGGVGGTYTNDFSLGSNGATSFINGSLDGANYFSKALSLAEINALYNLGNGTSYPSLEDLNGNTYAIGQSLNGTTDAFNIDSLLTPLASTTNGVWECIVTPNVLNVSQYIISFGDTNADELIGLYYGAGSVGKVGFFCRISGVNQFSYITDNVVLTVGVSAKIKVIQNGTIATIYIDGILVPSTESIGTDAGAYFNDASGLDNGRIGLLSKNSTLSGYADGSIQNVKIWSDATQTTLVANYPLNNVEGADQIDTIGAYNGTPIGTPVSTLASVNNTTIATIESSLVSWWDLNEESGTRNDAHGTNNLTDNNTVSYSLGKVQDTSTVGELVWNWIDQSSNAYIFNQDTVTAQMLLSANSVGADGVDDWLKNSTSNAFGSDSGGIIFISGYFDSSAQNRALALSSEGNTANFFQLGLGVTGEIQLIVNNQVGTNNTVKSTNTVSNGAYYYGYIKSTGTSYEISLNGTIETINVAAGVDNGQWLGDANPAFLYDNVTIGAMKRSDGPFYGPLNQNKIIYSNAALSAADISSINTFMSNPNN